MADKVYPVTHSDAEWRRILTPEQYDVMRAHGTEMPGRCSGKNGRAGSIAPPVASRCSNPS